MEIRVTTDSIDLGAQFGSGRTRPVEPSGEPRSGGGSSTTTEPGRFRCCCWRPRASRAVLRVRSGGRAGRGLRRGGDRRAFQAVEDILGVVVRKLF